jgi:hypothetical protein
MNIHPLDTAVTEGRHIDLSAGRRPDPKQIGGGAMREHGARTTGENGGHGPALDADEVRWGEGVDPTVDAMQSPCGGAPADRRRREPYDVDLGQGEDAVLSGGEPGKLGI